jgi:hypothetical protein
MKRTVQSSTWYTCYNSHVREEAYIQDAMPRIFALNPLPSPYAPKISIHPRIFAKRGLEKNIKLRRIKGAG